MRKIVSVLMCLMIVLSLFSCRIKDQKGEETITTNDQKGEENVPPNDTSTLLILMNTWAR